MKIEAAMRQSMKWSWQTLKFQKGNHRRKKYDGNFISWGSKKYLVHSFDAEEALSESKACRLCEDNT